MLSPALPVPFTAPRRGSKGGPRGRCPAGHGMVERAVGQPTAVSPGRKRHHDHDDTANGSTGNQAPEKLEHLTPRERSQLGKDARARGRGRPTPSSSPAPNRPDPVGLLERQATTRVPELVPIRYGRMLVSPFTFFRGAALIMASDLATTPRSGLDAQIAVTPTCPTSACSPRPSASCVRRQRLRRDAARALGVGRQAAGGQRRDRRPRPRIHGAGRGAPSPSPSAPPTATRCAARRAADPGRLVLPHRHATLVARPELRRRRRGSKARQAHGGPHAGSWPRRGPGTACRPSTS